MHWLLDLLFPEDCPACGRVPAAGPQRVCAACAAALPQLPRAAPCPWPLGGAWTLGPYDGPLGQLVRRGKYRPDPSALLRLGDRLAEAAAGRLPQVDAVVPAPSAFAKRWARGFDPAALLAAPVARRLDRPLLRRLRRGSGASQASASRDARLHRAQALITHTGPVPARVLLVDDVTTTGATASASASALLEAGARRVYLLTCAATFGGLTDH